MAEEKERPWRSVSQMKTATKCGEAYRIKKFQKPRPPRRPWAQTVGGTAFHETVVMWERSGRTLEPESVFLNEWDKALAAEKEEQPNLDLWMKPPGTKSTQTAINGVKKRFLEHDLPKYITRCEEAEWEVLELENGELALELEFEVDFNGLVVKGAVDRLQWWPEQKMITVEDTKTGSPESDDHDPRQLALYRFGISECYGIEFTHGRYWFTKVDRESEWWDLSKFDRDVLSKHYTTLDEIINRNLLLPNPGRACKLCDVRPWCSLNGWLQPNEELEV